MDIKDAQEFTTYRAKGKPLPSNYTNNQIFAQCKEKKQVIMIQAMNKAIQHTLTLVKEDWEGQNCKAKICPIRIQQKQRQDLALFIKLIQIQLEDEHIERDKANEEDESDEEYRQMSYYFGIPKDQILVKPIHGTDVRDITFDIYRDSLGFRQSEDIPPFKLFIYIVNQVTDLSQENMYVFSKGLPNHKFIAFVPTCEPVIDETFQMANKQSYEVFNTFLYKTRQLFAQYIYQCMNNPIIKAYMPGEVLNLLDDISFYSLEYGECCRRFDYCLERAMQLYPKDRPQTDFNQVIQGVQAAIKVKLKNYTGYQTNWIKIIKIILKDDVKYYLSSKALALQEQLGLHNPSDKKAQRLTEDILVAKIKQKIQQILIDSPFLKYFVDDIDIQSKKSRGRKRSRSQILEIPKYSHLTPRQRLENQITNMIRAATKDVRQFAMNIKWNNIRFEQRIRPQIPLKIANTMKEEYDIKELIDELTSSSSINLSRMMAFYNEQNMGYGLYLIKTVELSGLFILSRKQINPLAYTNYFDKSKF